MVNFQNYASVNGKKQTSIFLLLKYLIITPHIDVDIFLLNRNAFRINVLKNSHMYISSLTNLLVWKYLLKNE